MQDKSMDSLSGQQSAPQPAPVPDALVSQIPTADTPPDTIQADTVRAIAEHVLQRMCERHIKPPH